MNSKGGYTPLNLSGIGASKGKPGTSNTFRASNVEAAGSNATGSNYYLLEDQNDQQLNALSSKVSALKGISIQIHGDVEEQNRYLDERTGDFDKVGVFLQNSSKRFQMVMRNPRNRITCYVVLGLVVLFFFFYILSHHRS